MSVAEIVGGDELHDLGVAGLRVDLDLADVAAGREGEVGRVVEGALLQPRLHALRQVVRRVGGEADLVPRQLLVGAGDASPRRSTISMSPSEASIRCAAIFLAFASTLSSALTIADMPTAPEREP